MYKYICMCVYIENKISHGCTHLSLIIKLIPSSLHGVISLITKNNGHMRNALMQCNTKEFLRIQ